MYATLPYGLQKLMIGRWEIKSEVHLAYLFKHIQSFHPRLASSDSYPVNMIKLYLCMQTADLPIIIGILHLFTRT